LSAAEVSVAERVLTPDGIGAASRLSLATRLRSYEELTKPGITRMVVLTAAAGFYLAATGPLDLTLLLHTLIGTALVASAAGALNQWVERDADGHMRRTARRPLPSGRVSVSEALVFATVIAAAGLAQLLAFVNATTALIVLLSLVSYVFVYTPLKRRTWLATVVGAVPGALPILAGWTGAGTPLDARAWALFGVLFLWQMPHFYALAWVYREDYVRGGFRMLTAFDPTGIRTVRQVMLYTAALLAVSVLPYTLGLVGIGYLWGAIALGAAFLALGAALARERTDNRAWKLFFGSIIYLPALLVLLVAFKVPA
jgi:protoheme IX farnesyltransferase